MARKYLITLPLVLASTLCLPISAMADWPVAIIDNLAAHPAQASIRIDPLENDIGEKLEVTAVNAWSENGAQISITEDYLTYIPPKKHTGEDGFWYVIKDSQGRTNSVRIVVDVKTPNTALPTPQEDLAKTSKNLPVRINVLKNDLFSTTSIPKQPALGGMISRFDQWSKNGGRIEKIIAYPGASESLKYHLYYTPKAGFTGTDTFSYSVKDFESDLAGTVEQSTQVTIEVSESKPIQAAYPSAKPDTVSANCTESAVCAGSMNFVLRNDTGENLLLKLGSTWSKRGGRAYVSLTESTGIARINYIAPIPKLVEKAAKEGIYEDKVYYLIEDQYGRQNWSELTIDLTDKSKAPTNPTNPVAADDFDTTAKNTTVITDVLFNDRFLDGASLSQVSQGTLGGEVIIIEGKVSYTPADDFIGTDAFTYTISDGIETSTATVTVTVTDVTGSLYLNIENISVTVGPTTTGSFNNTYNNGNTIDKAINAPSADTEEVHNQASHIWFTAASDDDGLELLFDFRKPYNLSTLHFWNYTGESYDVDNIDFTFFDKDYIQVGKLSIQPSLGISGDSGIAAENINLSVPPNVQFVKAFLTGTSGEVDFQNIGFTAETF